MSKTEQNSDNPQTGNSSLGVVSKRFILMYEDGHYYGSFSPIGVWETYEGANPFVYSFDLNSYGLMQFPETNVFCLAGFSEKVFDIMKLMEQDKKALVNEIKKVSFS